ncbi:hypothetical protein Droror1_Dr00020005 [Drosera rotundifolia]
MKLLGACEGDSLGKAFSELGGDPVEEVVDDVEYVIIFPVRLEHVRITRREFELPDDFEYSVVLKYSEYFRLFDADEMRNKYIEIVERNERLSVCAIEAAREREYSEEEKRFHITVSIFVFS